MSEFNERRLLNQALDGASKIVLKGMPWKAVYSPSEAALLLGKDEQTLARWRRESGGPRYSQDPKTKSVYYTRERLFEYLGLNPSYYPHELGEIVSATISSLNPQIQSVFESYLMESRKIDQLKLDEQRKKDKKRQFK